jgi:crotonobetainyl-CoA:carnitine CoA-transferase CaiB-like acyl-CoA transferase
VYKTRDNRFISLTILERDRSWRSLCKHLDRPDLIEDDRFRTAELRARNRAELVRTLDAIFKGRTLEAWKQRLATLTDAWAPVQVASELRGDVQVRANGYVRQVTDGLPPIDLVASPVQFGGSSVDLHRAPLLGEHTEEVLLEFGVTKDEVELLKKTGILGDARHT